MVGINGLLEEFFCSMFHKWLERGYQKLSQHVLTKQTSPSHRVSPITRKNNGDNSQGI